VLSLLLVLKQESKAQTTQTPAPSVLVAPASLLANWAAEMELFAPTLKFLIAHPSASGAENLKAMTSDTLVGVDLVITSYGALLRYDWLSRTLWRVAVIDEAQAIKNPGAKQTRAVKNLIADTRIALTGTPVENRLSDLWSIFDFTHPGLLGSGQAFGRYVRRLAEARTYGPLRELVRPYILRRLKTDKSATGSMRPDGCDWREFERIAAVPRPGTALVVAMRQTQQRYCS
jgi:SNF2 family DNA or RNA helicase